MMIRLSHASRLPYRHDDNLADRIVKIRWHVNLRYGLSAKDKRTLHLKSQVITNIDISPHMSTDPCYRRVRRPMLTLVVLL